MNTKLKNLIKGIIVLIVFAMAIIVADRILVLKSKDGYLQMRSYYKQRENTVDVLFLGSSKVYCQIDTGLIWDEHGIASFDLGGAEATPWDSYYFMVEALKTQKPKVIFYDAGILAFRSDVEYQPTVWAMTNNYGIKWNSNRLNDLKENCENKETFRSLLFPLNTMHSRYSELTEEDFNCKQDSISYKGFDYRDAVTIIEPTGITEVEGETAISPRKEKYLLKMFELAKQNNIPFVVMVTPHVVYEENGKIYNYIHRLCDENGIGFLDMNQKNDEIGIDFSSDFAEELHLNFSGTQKLSKYLSDYINSNYELADHRGDKLYASWEKDALINRQNRINYELRNTSDTEKLKKILNNENYLIFHIDKFNYLRVYDGSDKVVAIGDSQTGSGTIKVGDEVINFTRESDTTKIKLVSDEIIIGWPWSRVIVYDKALGEIVFNKEIEEQ